MLNDARWDMVLVLHDDQYDKKPGVGGGGDGDNFVIMHSCNTA